MLIVSMIILLSYIRAPFAYTTVNFYDDVLPLLIFFSFFNLQPGPSLSVFPF